VAEPPLDLSPSAQQLADFLSQCIAILKGSAAYRVKAQKSADALKKKLYTPLSQGSVDEATIESLRVLAHQLRGGYHEHVAREAGNMMRQTELRSIGGGLLALKGLATTVGQFAKMQQWPAIT
jgi:hypothetical protein